MTDITKLIRSIPIWKFPVDEKIDGELWYNWNEILSDAADEISMLRDILTDDQYKKVYGKKRKKKE